MKSTADIVIIGAGVSGCSTAYHLTKMGITDVAVVEMEQVGSGSSSKSASMLSLQYCYNPLVTQMALYSYKRYMAFEEEFGVSTDFKKIGWLNIATSEKAQELLEQTKMRQSFGIKSETLTPAEIKYRYPELNTQDIAVGVWGADDGPFDPYMIMQGYTKKASQQGAKLYEGVRATDIRLDKGQVTGVVTTKGVIATNTVVNAAGPWAIEVGKWVGVKIPIINRSRSIVVTGPFPEIPSNNPLIEDITMEWYYRPEGPGILMGMGITPVENLNVQFTPQIRDELIKAAIQRVPILEKASFLTGWSGIRPTTSDSNPILGGVPGLTGFVLNCGWGGAGIIQSPAGGQVIAEYIVDGYASTIDISSCDIKRFA